jgi:hypothetical protein
MSVYTNPSNSTAEETAAYVAALLDLVGTQDPLAVLATTPDAAARATAGMGDASLRQSEKPGKWSIAQILQHLADSEIVFSWRLRLILAQDRPTLTGYDQDLCAERLGYAEADPTTALQIFRTLRQETVRLLRRASPADLKRVGIHSERGEESIEHLRKLYAGHDLLHLKQLARVRVAVGG